jgi:hypothetical protein
MSVLLLRDIGEDVRAAGRARLTSELASLLTDHDVSGEVQGWFGHFRYPISTIGKFAHADETSSGMRVWLKADLGLDVSLGLAHRMQVAAILDAWTAARKQTGANAADVDSSEWEEEESSTDDTDGSSEDEEGSTGVTSSEEEEEDSTDDSETSSMSDLPVDEPSRGRKRAGDELARWPSEEDWGQKGDGGGWARKVGKKSSWETEDGQLVCFAFQKDKCRRKDCKFLHVCRGCHQAWDMCTC